MKKLLFVCTIVFTLMINPCFAIEYCKDFLESENPGGWSGSSKTWDDEWTMSPGDSIEMEIWLNDLPSSLLAAGCFITYDPALVNITNVTSPMILQMMGLGMLP